MILVESLVEADGSGNVHRPDPDQGGYSERVSEPFMSHLLEQQFPRFTEAFHRRSDIVVVHAFSQEISSVMIIDLVST